MTKKELPSWIAKPIYFVLKYWLLIVLMFILLSLLAKEVIWHFYRIPELSSMFDNNGWISELILNSTKDFEKDHFVQVHLISLTALVFLIVAFIRNWARANKSMWKWHNSGIPDYAVTYWEKDAQQRTDDYNASILWVLFINSIILFLIEFWFSKSLLFNAIGFIDILIVIVLSVFFIGKELKGHRFILK